MAIDVNCDCLVCASEYMPSKKQPDFQTNSSSVFLSATEDNHIRTFADYQADANRTEIEGTIEAKLLKNTLGLAGEVGELVELVKKSVYHGTPMARHALVEEIGDVLWYLSQFARVNGIGLEECAEKNILKLRVRFPEGWSQEAANARADKK